MDVQWFVAAGELRAIRFAETPNSAYPVTRLPKVALQPWSTAQGRNSRSVAATRAICR
jgi:hypothetical protein